MYYVAACDRRTNWRTPRMCLDHARAERGKRGRPALRASDPSHARPEGGTRQLVLVPEGEQAFEALPHVEAARCGEARHVDHMQRRERERPRRGERRRLVGTAIGEAVGDRFKGAQLEVAQLVKNELLELGAATVPLGV
uniref:Uncharacterized protein n=1 Tax=Calcidiscus leptoporus TaxID=127549 RepID=A0A7S0JBE8_9EUKA